MLKPVRNTLVVEMLTLSGDKITPGGIMLPDVTEEKVKSLKGLIVAAGPGGRTADGKTLPMDYKPGQKIVFGKFKGHIVTDNTREYRVLLDEDVLCLIEDDKK